PGRLRFRRATTRDESARSAPVLPEVRGRRTSAFGRHVVLAREKVRRQAEISVSSPACRRPMDPPGPVDRHPLRAPAAVRGSSSPVSQCVATYAGTSGEGTCLMDVVLVRLACGARGFPASFDVLVLALAQLALRAHAQRAEANGARVRDDP